VVIMALYNIFGIGYLGCIVGGGWYTLPMWVLISIAAIPLYLIEILVLGNYELITDLFLRSSEALITSLTHLSVFVCSHTARGTTVDWAATYDNYDVMAELVENFSEAWRTLFFVIEFVTVPSAGLALLGVVSDTIALHRAIVTTASDELELDLPLALRVGSVLVGLQQVLIVVAVLVLLWVTASRITNACDLPRARGLAAMSEAAKLKERPRSPDRDAVTSFSEAGTMVMEHCREEERRQHDVDVQSKRARGFVAYAELRAPGFSCHGITISYHLGMLLVYPLVTFGVTLAFPLAISLL